MTEFKLGDRVIFNGMALDGLDDPGVIIGFTDPEAEHRPNQPIVRWIKRTGIFTTGQETVIHPHFLWLESDALRLLAQNEMK